MASKPFPDYRGCTWKMKYKPDPDGPWVSVTLGKDPRLEAGRPRKGKTQPQAPADIALRAREFEDIEFRARHGLAQPKARQRRLRDFAAEYKEGYPADRDSGSVILMRRYVDQFVDWCDGRGIVDVSDVTEGACKRFLEYRKANAQTRSGMAAGTTMKTIRGYIAAMFTRAVDDKLIPRNPWLAAPALKGAKPDKVPRFWSREEIALIAAACRREWHRDLVAVLAGTGIRISATLAMEWSWIDFAGRSITVPAGDNKGDIRYSVYLFPDVEAILARRKEEADPRRSRHVFANPRGEPYSYEGARGFISRAIKRAKVPRGTLHDLRHSFGRWLHIQGVPQAVISAMMGHASIATTEIYTEMSDKDAIKFMRQRSRTSPDRGPADGDGNGPPPASGPS